MRVRDVGDVSGVVLRLHLDFEGLEWLVNELEPHGWQDEAVKHISAGFQGTIDVSAELQLSSDGAMTSQTGQRITGQLGFTWWLSPASGFRLAASLTEDRGAVVFGAQLSGSYGLLDGTFAR